MVESKPAAADDNLPNYEEIEIDFDQEAPATGAAAAAATTGAAKPTTDNVGVHSTSFKDMVLRPELLQSIVDCGFEHPSDVQQKCIPQAIMGVDVLCQAVSGMGKTAVFVTVTLERINPDDGLQALCLVHTRELAYQVAKEFERFKAYLDGILAQKEKEILEV